MRSEHHAASPAARAEHSQDMAWPAEKPKGGPVREDFQAPWHEARQVRHEIDEG